MSAARSGSSANAGPKAWRVRAFLRSSFIARWALRVAGLAVFVVAARFYWAAPEIFAGADQPGEAADLSVFRDLVLDFFLDLALFRAPAEAPFGLAFWVAAPILGILALRNWRYLVFKAGSNLAGVAMTAVVLFVAYHLAFSFKVLGDVLDVSLKEFQTVAEMPAEKRSLFHDYLDRPWTESGEEAGGEVTAPAPIGEGAPITKEQAERVAKRKEEFFNVGETATFLLALATSAVTLGYLFISAQVSLGRRRRNTRSWVLYNIMNRMNQDHAVLEFINNRVFREDENENWDKVHDLVFKRPSFSMQLGKKLGAAPIVTDTPPKDDAEREEMEKYFADAIKSDDVFAEFFAEAEKEGDCLYSLKLRLRRMLSEVCNIFDGFSQTWKNDDVLSDRIAFDFSLLTRTERRVALAYFENYNNLQDKISILLPFLRVSGGYRADIGGAGHLPRKSDEDDLGTREFSARNLKRLEEIFVALKRRLGEGAAVERIYYQRSLIENYHIEVLELIDNAEQRLGLDIEAIGRQVLKEQRLGSLDVDQR